MNEKKDNHTRWVVIVVVVAGLTLWLGNQKLTVVATIYSILVALLLCFVGLVIVAGLEGGIDE